MLCRLPSHRVAVWLMSYHISHHKVTAISTILSFTIHSQNNYSGLIQSSSAIISQIKWSMTLEMWLHLKSTPVTFHKQSGNIQMSTPNCQIQNTQTCSHKVGSCFNLSALDYTPLNPILCATLIQDHDLGCVDNRQDIHTTRWMHSIVRWALAGMKITDMPHCNLNAK